jgi:hypothetical protein
VAASTINSTISAAQTTIAADGSSTTTITVQLKDALGNNLTSSGGTVIIFTSAGTISVVTDNGNGTYTAVLTSAATPGASNLSFTINGTPATGAGSSATVTFTSVVPLYWLDVNVQRQKSGIKINWSTVNETNLRDYDVERSFDAVNWTTVIARIPANNVAGDNYYEQFDSSNIARKLFYRIKQTDIDGKSEHSVTKSVAATSVMDNIVVYPVPAFANFWIQNSGAAKITGVKMFNMNGLQVKSWSRIQASYSLQDVAPGVYILRIETNDGKTQILRLSRL